MHHMQRQCRKDGSCLILFRVRQLVHASALIHPDSNLCTAIVSRRLSATCSLHKLPGCRDACCIAKGIATARTGKPCEAQVGRKPKRSQRLCSSALEACKYFQLFSKYVQLFSKYFQQSKPAVFVCGTHCPCFSCDATAYCSTLL